MTMQTNNNHIYQYIRDRNRNRIGVMYAIYDPESGSYGIGWSKVHKPLDTFNRNFGIDLALVRAKASLKIVDSVESPPDSIRWDMMKFLDLTVGWVMRRKGLVIHEKA